MRPFLPTVLTSWLLMACAGEPKPVDELPDEVDADRDGHAASVDCDDSDPTIHPDATELCDEDDRDEDCDGLSDDADPSVDPATFSPAWTDADGDGYGEWESSAPRCDLLEDQVGNGTDCDDTDSAVHPGADEVCGGGDEDCDLLIDEDEAVDAPTWGLDGDGDGYGSISSAVVSCQGPEGFIQDASDCDDADPETHPGAEETCNSLDDNCDGEVDGKDTTDAQTWCRDLDGDEFGDEHSCTIDCELPEGYIDNDRDCDDLDPNINPTATEVCDEGDVDEDCDGMVNDDDDVLMGGSDWYADNDGDGYGGMFPEVTSCDTPDGLVVTRGDCDDDDAEIHPAAMEVCDAWNADEDCDGEADDDDDSTAVSTLEQWFLDADGDGHGDASYPILRCDRPEGYSARSTDCDDGDAGRNPDLLEVCDDADRDEDCNGLAEDADPSLSTAWYLDEDGDEFGTSESALITCDPPSEYVSLGRDCDDEDERIHPDATEVCGDGVDDNCDGFVRCGVTVDDAERVFLGTQEFGWAGGSVASVGDVNGDGIDDLLVGAFAEDASGVEGAGNAYLIFGGGEGEMELPDADLVLHGAEALDVAGLLVSGLDDVDGDGLPDLAVYAPGHDVDGFEGMVFLPSGEGTGTMSLLDSDAEIALDFETVLSDVKGIGDVDGDGLGDLALGASDTDGPDFVYLFTDIAPGRTEAGEATAVLPGEVSSNFGGSLAGAGDTNGDGLADLLVGAWGRTGGSTYLFLGPVPDGSSSDTADAELYGVEDDDASGYRVAAGGDINGDGYRDLLTGCYENCGVYVVYGPVSGRGDLTIARAHLDEDTEHYHELAGGGDLNRDGFDDVAISDTSDDTDADDAGRATVYLGPLAGSLDDSDADAAISGGLESRRVGSSLGFIGAQDGSEGEDLFIGAISDDTLALGAGAVFLFSASSL